MLSSTAITPAISNQWPEGGLENVSACPVCGGAKRELVHHGLEDKVFRCAPGLWSLHRCGSCGSGYLDPRPTPETIGLAYQRYWTHQSAAGADPSRRSWWRRRRNAQCNTFLNQQFGYHLSPVSRMPAWLTVRRRQRFNDRVAYLPCPGTNGRLLDLGCGNGAFLLQMRALGWGVKGIEPDPKAAAQARALGLDVQASSLAKGVYDENYFDAITLKHVIEHLHDPVGVLHACRSALKPGGRIYIATPNFASAGHAFYGRHYFPLQPPSHLVLFTLHSLQAALKRVGFDPDREPRPRVVPREWFEASIRIRNGADVMNKSPALSLGEKLEAVRLARRCAVQTRAQPDLIEELVLLARKPA